MDARKALVAVMAPLVAAATVGMAGTAAAAPDSATTLVPLQNKVRQCDFVPAQFADGRGTGWGSATAHIGTPDPGTVSAQVYMQTAQPNTAYQVRVIQMPRPASAPCGAGTPGTVTGALHTDAAGTATTTVSGPLMSGATGAWVVIEGPPFPGKPSGEVYTSDFVVNLA